MKILITVLSLLKLKAAYPVISVAASSAISFRFIPGIFFELLGILSEELNGESVFIFDFLIFEITCF